MADRRSLWAARHQEIAVEEARVRDFQQKAARHVALELEKITGSEPWDLYVAHLKVLEESAKHEEILHADKLLGRFLGPEAYGQVRVDQAYCRGRHRAFAEAIQTIKDLIARGQEPQEETHAA